MSETRRREEAADRAEMGQLTRAIAAIGEDAAGRRGIVGEIACPNCTGRLRYGVAARNGHLRASCSTPGCVRFIQ